MNPVRLTCLAALLLLPLCACKGGGQHAGEEHEVAVAQQPALSLTAGIAAAQKSEPGGTFLAAEIENEGGKVICSVVLAETDGAHEINIDATTGAVLNTENEKLGPKSHALLQSLGKDGHAATSPAQAIEAALKKVPGTWALEVKLAMEGSALFYEVVLAGGHEPMVAQVSAADGLVKRVAEQEEEDEEGEHAEAAEKN